MLSCVQALRACIVSLITALCLCSSALGAPSWEQIHEEEGIKVYRRDSALGELPDFKGTGRVKASLFDVLAVIRNVNRRTEWVFRCEASKVVKRFTDFEVLLYHKTYSPWPASDRDAAIRTQLYELEPGKHYLAHFRGVKSELIPERESNIRLPQIEGYYLLKELSPEETHVTYFVHLDPGGYLPHWLVKMTTVDFPTETLMGLRKQVKKTKAAGVYRSFHERWNPRVRPEGTPAPHKLMRPSRALMKRLGI